MYYKELETNADYRYQHNQTLMKAAAERLAKVASLKKLKKKQKKESE